MIALAIVILVRKRGWLRNIVILALAMLFLSELLVVINFVTGHELSRILCPVGNMVHLLAIPLFSLVYYREQADEKKQADRALDEYREHLEDLVTSRTKEVTLRNAELAVQNAIAATISQSLDLAVILKSVLQKAASLLEIPFGCILLSQRSMIRDILTAFDTSDGPLRRTGQSSVRFCLILAR